MGNVAPATIVSLIACATEILAGLLHPDIFGATSTSERWPG